MLWTLGLLSLFYVLKTPILIVYRLFRAPVDLTKKAKWAVITGATDGIGKAMATELASKGLNVLLISRTESKLAATKEELQSQFKSVEVECLAIDFSKFDSAARSTVAEMLKSLETRGGVAVLVNNVGVSYPFPKYFDELDDDQVAGLVELNVNSTVWMTRLALPGMLARKSGFIVNMSSAASLQPSPLLAGYCAAKSFVNGFGSSLAVEYKSKGISVQTQVPLFVVSKLSKIRKASLLVPKAHVFAKAAVAAIGYEYLISPYWAHALQNWVMTLLPAFVLDGIVMSMHASTRKRGMKKEAEKEAAKK